MRMKNFWIVVFGLALTSGVMGAVPSGDNFLPYDTCVVSGFDGEEVVYSKTFQLSPYLDVVLDVMANDTLNGGDTVFDGDSCLFRWLVEVGHMTINGNGNKDSLWDVMNPILIDTFDMTTAANMVVSVREIDTLGIFNRSKKTIDTLSVIGWAFQSRHIRFMENHQFYRIKFEGISGNVGTAMRLQCGQDRRVYVPIRSK